MRGWLRTVVVAGLGALGAGLCAGATAPWPQLVGTPLVAMALAWALVPLPPAIIEASEWIGRRPWASWGLPILAVIVAVSAAYHPMLFGSMPWAAGQADHPVHQYQAWVLVESMLPTGRLTGWSDLRWAGYPALELYPIGGPLWVALTRGLTLGALDWEATYSLAILAMLVLNSLAVYVVTRRFVGPGAALLAVALVLLERGWPRQGGDHYIVDVGVWPVSMGVAPLLLSLERLWSWLFARATRRALVGACLFAAWAMLCHPLYLAVLLIAGPTVLFVAVAQGARSDRAALGVTLTLVLGFALVAFWYQPFLARRHLSEPGGAPYRSLGNLSEGLAMLGWLPRFWVIAAAASVLGGAVAIIRGGGFALLAILSIVLIGAAASTPLELSDGLASLAGSVQQERFLIPVRVLFCILGAGGIVEVFRALRRRERTWDLRRRLALLALVALLAPFGAGAIEAVVKHLVVPIVEFEHGPDLDHRRDLLNLCRWMRDQPRSGLLAPRTAWYVGHGRHEYDNAPVHCGVAQIIDTPAETFASRPGGISEREVLAFGVIWVIADRPIVGRESYLSLQRRFGRLHVYRVSGKQSGRVTLLGEGSAAIETFDDERIVVRATGLSQPTRLVLHVTRHPNWVATLDGQPIAISGGHLGLPRADLIHVTVTNGVVEFRWRRGVAEWTGVAVTIVAAILLLLIGGVPWRGAQRTVEERGGRLSKLLSRTMRLPAWVRAFSLFLAAAAAFFLLLGHGPEREPSERDEEQARSEALVDRLASAESWIVTDGQRRVLQRRWDGRLGRRFPPEVRVDSHVEAIELGDPRRVIALRLRPGEELHLRFPAGDVRGLRGWFARGGRGRGRTAIAVWNGHRRLARFEAQRLGQWESFEATGESREGPLEVVVTADESSSRAVLLDGFLIQ